MIQELTGLSRKGYRLLKRVLVPHLHKPDQSADYIFLGSEYGGWPVIRGTLTAESKVYSFGVGDDISFDVALIEQFGVEIKAFDPTPRCVEWVRSAELPSKFKFIPVGLSDRAQILSFSAPLSGAHMSYTVGDRTVSTDVVLLPVKALDQIMAEQGDSHYTIDLLKMDIEGSEYAALPDMISKGILPKQLCVEFHHGMFGFSRHQTNNAVLALREVGYKPYYISDAGREYAFYR